LLTYKIQKPKAPRKVRLFQGTDFREQVLKNNLKKTPFQVGDVVKFKKPRRPIIWGTVVEIQDKVSEITWGNGGALPMNIIIEVVKIDPANGIVYGTERVKTNVKKVTFYLGVK
jgi:hypothetical protein